MVTRSTIGIAKHDITLRNTNILKILQSFEWKPGDIKSHQVTFPTRDI